MDDVIFISLMFVFVIVAALFVIGCDKIIGPDDAALSEQIHQEDRVTLGGKPA